MNTILLRSPIFPNGMDDVIKVEVQHVVNIIVTRFFIKGFATNRFKNNFDEYEYLSSRCKVFLDICYPSVIRQLKDNDRWYLFISSEFQDFVKSLLGRIDERVIIIDGLPKNAIFAEINQLIYKGFLPVVTRLDNDDTLSCEYLSLLDRVASYIYRNNIFDKGIGVVIFPFAIQYHTITHQTNVLMYNNGHTTSFIYSIHLSSDSPWIFDINHGKIFDEKIDCILCNTSLPMWSENISDSNQCNKIIRNRIITNGEILSKIFPDLCLRNVI